MNKSYYSPLLDFICLTQALLPVLKAPLLLLLWKDPGSARTNIPFQDVGKTSGEWQVPCLALPWPHSQQRVSLLEEKVASTCFPLSLLINWLDLGSLQLCLGIHLLYLPHPLRILLQVILSTLMTALAVSELCLHALNSYYFYLHWGII